MPDISFYANYEQSQGNHSWEVLVDGKYANAINTYLISDGIPESGADKIIENAAKTLSYCPDPHKNDLCQKTGIVIGKVQSGKTSNFIAISALAFDNGYDIVVVLGGTKKPLVTQNRDRIREYFEDVDDVLVLDTVEYYSVLTKERILQFIRMGKKVIIVALKTPSKIDAVVERVFKQTSFEDKPILVIDDEGDEASPNTLVAKGKKSSTYKSIESMKAILNRHCFLSVTATPQANLLINTLDILSPDFGVLVEPGEGYCGLDVFHKDKTYTIEIPESETSLLDEGVPQSFIMALAMFFVACAIRIKRGLKQDEKVSMLIHPSQMKADHEAVYKKVNAIVSDWIEYSKNKSDISYIELCEILRKAYNEYAKTTIPAIPPFESIENEIIEALNGCGTHILNGDHIDRADEIFTYNIYVGGAMLGRGITLKGLTITYIIRTSKGVSNTDTVQQRARWFGYKTKYLDLCRVFAVPKILKEFQSIREHEEDLWYTVRQSNMQGELFKDMSRIFVLDNGLRMTRSNVAKTENYSFAYWHRQRKFQRDADYISSNKNIIGLFRDHYGVHKYEKFVGNGAPYMICNSKFDIVFDELLDKFVFPEGDSLNIHLLRKLKSLLERKGLNPKIDVIWMRDDINKPSEHPVDDDGSIHNYSVGRRPKDTSRAPIYAGDDNEFKKPDTMQLQVYMIKDTRTGIISPTLSLYVPDDVVKNLANLQIRSC